MNKTTIILFIIVFIVLAYLVYTSQQQKKLWEGQMGMNAIFMKKLGISTKELIKEAPTSNDDNEDENGGEPSETVNENPPASDSGAGVEYNNAEADHQENINKGIEFMVERIMAGEKQFNAEDLQFYENYKEQIESLLVQEQQKSAGKKSSAKSSKKKMVVKVPGDITITKKGVNRKKNNNKLELATADDSSGETEDNKLSGE